MMKAIKKLPLIIAALILVLTAATGIALSANGAQKVYAAGAYDFEFTTFNVNYDIRADRTMDVTLDLGVHYLGYDSTGIMHDIPVNAGDRVRNIKAYELDEFGEEQYLDYKVKREYAGLITVDMGDYSNKTDETHYYRIKYEYAITKPRGKNAIWLNAVGFGSEGEINDVNVSIKLPDGLDYAKRYTNKSGEGDGVSVTPKNGVISIHYDYLPSYEGVTVEMIFKVGVLSTKADMTPYYVIIAGCVILGLLFAVKFLAFNKDGLSPVSDTQAPAGMGPLVMGKLIDNRVDQSDVTSLIFYWANKGYLKIDLHDENDIELIRIMQHLPESAPKHQHIMYEGLFKSGDIVKINDLSQSFYPVVEAVTKEVNAENSKLYDGKSMGVAVLFALVGGLMMCLAPIILAMTTISFKLFSIVPLFMIIPAFIVFALAQSVKYNTLKYKKKKIILMYAGVVLLSLAFTAVYVLFIPSYVIEIVPKLILCAIGFTIVILSTTIISRTEAYTEKLNHIVGFRDFIKYAEKDKLEALLEGNPEYYYQVLPYAIVLGVSDIWEDKFAALTVPPPTWTTNSYSNDMFSIVVFNSVIRRANLNMVSSFVSRPSSPSSGSFSGGGHGGSFGGFSGGGHGGGGFRGR
ncbi:MAG: DUF2207 domain-containing protein [Clostridia bacterium]|nr:DUF2207 domain-containing protein [Clostridia bacterium]